MPRPRTTCPEPPRAPGRLPRLKNPLRSSYALLDNFTHVQASWPTQGLKVAEIALEFGCDDFGSTMLEENVVSAAGTSLRHAAEISIQRHIRGAGYAPAQRDSSYRILRVVEQVPEPAAPRRSRV